MSLMEILEMIRLVVGVVGVAACVSLAVWEIVLFAVMGILLVAIGTIRVVDCGLDWLERHLDRSLATGGGGQRP
jgi:hypothetical protein